MDDLKNIWKQLIAFYQPVPKPSEEFFRAWLAEMQKYDIADVREMIAHIERHNNRMPALSEQIAVVDSISFNRQQSLWQKEKEQERKDTTAFWSGQHADDYGKQCLKLIKGILAETIDRGQFLSGMRQLGMLSEADSLQAYYAERGLE